jgi:hypothetical protein
VGQAVFAGWCDRAGRAKIEAACAADDLRARMRAQPLGEGNVTWLVEGADEIAGFQNRAQHRGGTARIGAQISVTQIRGRKQGSSARQVEHDIAA